MHSCWLGREATNQTKNNGWLTSFYLFLQSAQKVFGGDIKTHILLFTDKPEDEDQMEAFRGAAKDFKGKVRRISYIKTGTFLGVPGLAQALKYLNIQDS